MTDFSDFWVNYHFNIGMKQKLW